MNRALIADVVLVNAMVEPTSDPPFSNGHAPSPGAETLSANVESNGQQMPPPHHRRVLVGERATVVVDEPLRTSVSPATPTDPPTIEATQPSPEPADKTAPSAEQAPQRGWVWASRGLWLGVVAYVVSLGGTYMLADVAARNTAMLLLGIASVLAVVAWGNQPWIAPFGPRIATERAPWATLLSNIGWNRAFRLVGIGVAAVVLWQADRQYLVSPNEMFGLAGWLWLAAIALLIISTAGWPRSRRVQASAAPEASATVDKREIDQPPGWPVWEIAVFITLVVLAVVLRVWNLRNDPFVIHPDEIYTAENAYAYITGPYPSVFQTVWDGIYLPALWFLGVAQSLTLGGSTLEALRMPAALFGAATVVPFYGLLRGAWGRTAAIAGTAIMAFSAVDLQYSRVTINNITTQFFWAACFFFLLRAVRTRRPLDWVLAGLFGGLGEHFYYGTRLLFVLLIVFVLYLLVVHWRQGWRLLGGFALMALGFLAGFGPLLAYFLNTPGMYFGRGQGVLTWNRIPTGWDDLVAAWYTLWPIMSDNLLAFSTEAGRDAFYFGTLLFPVEAALLVLGFGLLVWRWKHPAAFLTLLSGLAVLFVGGTLVPSAGNLNHWTPAYPAFYTAIALPIAAWVTLAGALRFPGSIRSPLVVRRAVSVVVGVGLVVLGAWNVDYYFNRYVATRPDAEVLTDEHRTQADLARQGYLLRNIGRTYYGIDSLALGYLSRPVQAEAAQHFNPPAELPLAQTGTRGAAFFFRDNDQYLPIVKSLYPGGEVIPVTMENGHALYNTYVVPGDRINATYGVFVQLMDPTSGALMRNDHVNVVGTLPRGVSFPLRARWSGAFFLGNGGPYEIAVHGAPAALMVDGVGSDGAGGSVQRTLQAGWHRFMVTVDLAAPTPITFTAASLGSGADGFVFPREQLWPEPPGMGLFGSVLGADMGQGQRPVPRVDPYIAFGSVARPGGFGPAQGASFPVSVRWVGEINAPVAGSYNLEVRTDGQAHLIVDGTQDVWACEGMDSGGVATVGLSAGWHPIVLDYVGMPGTSDLHLWWSMPGGGRTLVPPSALRYFPADGSTLPDVPAPSTSIQCPAR